MLAAPDTFEIVVEGEGGRAAMPYQTVDSVAIVAQVVTNLQHVVSRNTDPLDYVVVSVTKFVGGTAHNVVPARRDGGDGPYPGRGGSRAVPETMEQIIKGITEAHGAS